MKPLVIFSYKQPHKNAKFRWGVQTANRDTLKEPLAWKTINGSYRRWDRLFRRTRNLSTVRTTQGPKAFYRERTNWKISIPFVGSLVAPFLPAE